MNKVISGYFDDAHRGLKRQQSGAGGMAQSPSGVQLPPLRPDSSGEHAMDDMSYQKAIAQSQSMGYLEFSEEHASRGIQKERLDQALIDNSKLGRKVRALQDQLAITSAKKEAFKAQAQRLEQEFKKGREQSDTLQRELLEARREAGQLSKEAQEAIAMMTEMRKAHIHEVRLLQRGLQARGNDASMKNRVNETADLVDKLGRSVVQRDEAIRDKTKLQAQFNKALQDLRVATDNVNRLKKNNRSLSENLKEAQRRARFVPPQPTVDNPPEDSDEEFEQELSIFERRFTILEEGPAGLDILASNLSKEKQDLEKRLKASQDTNKSLNATIMNWKRLGAEKDQEIADLNAKITKMMKERAVLEDSIAQKRREIEQQVAEERALLEARISELESEADNARAVADGMDKASTKLTQELVKVHEQYSRQPGTVPEGGAAPEPGAEPAPAAEPAAEPAATGAEEPPPSVILASAEQKAKTGELLKMEVFKMGDDTELRVKEMPAGEDVVLAVKPELLKELDETDPYTELFSRVGMDLGPPRQPVVSTKLGSKEVTLQPAGSSVLLSVFRYGASRFFFSGLDLATQGMLDLAVMEDQLTPELEQKLAACDGNDSLFDVLAAGLSLETGATSLSFQA